MEIEEIDLSAAYWTVGLPDEIKRSLIRYFTPRIVARIMDREKAQTGREAPIKNMEPVDAFAWRLADKAVREMREAIEEPADIVDYYKGKTAGEALNEVCQEIILTIEHDHLYPDDGLDLEISAIGDLAFNRPLELK